MYPESANAGTARPPASMTSDANVERQESRRERITFAWYRIIDRLNVGVTAAHVAAASLIGFEGVVFVLAFTSMWPIAIPFVVGVLALSYFLRERVRALGRCLRSGF